MSDLKQLKKRLAAVIKKLSSDRDELRNLIDEANDISDCTDDAIESLKIAADRLSERV